MIREKGIKDDIRGQRRDVINRGKIPREEVSHVNRVGASEALVSDPRRKIISIVYFVKSFANKCFCFQSVGNSIKEYKKCISVYSIRNQVRYKGNLGKNE